jgi:hypothetical protein
MSARPTGFHVDLLGVLFRLWGVLVMLIGASTLALAVAAVALIRTHTTTGGAQFAAGLTTATFIFLALIALVWGFAHVIVGRRLRQHTPWARLAALALGSADLVLLPHGTALGGYSLYTLLGDDAKRLFDA